MDRGLWADASWALTERIFRLIVAVAVGAYCARVLGPSDYGVFSYALSIVALFAFLPQAGVDGIAVRDLASRPENAADTVSAAFFIKFAGGLAALVFSIATAWLMADPDLPIVALVALLSGCGVVQACNALDLWLQANGHFAGSSKSKISVIALSGMARVAAVGSPFPLVALAAVLLVESILLGALLWLVARRHGFLFMPGWRASVAREARCLWQGASRLLAASLAIAIYSRIGVLMLGQVAGAREVGWFNAALSIAEGFYAVPVALLAAATPRLARSFRQGEGKFELQLGQGIRLLSLAGLLVAAAVTLAARPLIGLLFGPAYSPSAGILAILIWSTWMVFVSTASEPWFLNRGKFSRYLAKTCIAAMANIVLNILLIPRFGALGTAMAMLVSYAISAVACNALWKDTRELFRLQVRAMFMFKTR